MADLTARYAIYDDFLDEDLAGRLLQFALDHEAQFEATKVGQDGVISVASDAIATSSLAALSKSSRCMIAACV